MLASASSLSIFFALAVMIATKEEMDAVNLEKDARDFCAHKLIDYRRCRDENSPWFYKCAHEKHVYIDCQYDE